MKHLRQLCAALALAGVLSASAFAGEISCPVAPPPPPPAASVMVTLLEALLSVF